MDISVIIVAWNAKPYLELCLESLAEAPPRRSMEIIVVDNASADGSAEMIESRFLRSNSSGVTRILALRRVIMWAFASARVAISLWSIRT